MAKAKKVEKVNTISAMNLSDLSLEKRIEVFNKRRDEFLKTSSDELGLTENCELVFDRRGIVPRIVIIDLLAKQNENQNQPSQNQ